MFGKTHKKEVETNVVILTLRSNRRRGTRPCGLCGLPVDSAVDRRAYVSVIDKHWRRWKQMLLFLLLGAIAVAALGLVGCVCCPLIAPLIAVLTLA